MSDKHTSSKAKVSKAKVFAALRYGRQRVVETVNSTFNVNISKGGEDNLLDETSSTLSQEVSMETSISSEGSPVTPKMLPSDQVHTSFTPSGRPPAKDMSLFVKNTGLPSMIAQQTPLPGQLHPSGTMNSVNMTSHGTSGVWDSQYDFAPQYRTNTPMHSNLSQPISRNLFLDYNHGNNNNNAPGEPQGQLSETVSPPEDTVIHRQTKSSTVEPGVEAVEGTPVEAVSKTVLPEPTGNTSAKDPAPEVNKEPSPPQEKPQSSVPVLQPMVDLTASATQNVVKVSPQTEVSPQVPVQLPTQHGARSNDTLLQREDAPLLVDKKKLDQIQKIFQDKEEELKSFERELQMKQLRLRHEEQLRQKAAQASRMMQPPSTDVTNQLQAAEEQARVSKQRLEHQSHQLQTLERLLEEKDVRMRSLEDMLNPLYQQEQRLTTEEKQQLQSLEERLHARNEEVKSLEQKLLAVQQAQAYTSAHIDQVESPQLQAVMEKLRGRDEELKLLEKKLLDLQQAQVAPPPQKELAESQQLHTIQVKLLASDEKMRNLEESIQNLQQPTPTVAQQYSMDSQKLQAIQKQLEARDTQMKLLEERLLQMQQAPAGQQSPTSVMVQPPLSVESQRLQELEEALRRKDEQLKTLEQRLDHEQKRQRVQSQTMQSQDPSERCNSTTSSWEQEVKVLLQQLTSVLSKPTGQTQPSSPPPADSQLSPDAQQQQMQSQPQQNQGNYCTNPGDTINHLAPGGVSNGHPLRQQGTAGNLQSTQIPGSRGCSTFDMSNIPGTSSSNSDYRSHNDSSLVQELGSMLSARLPDGFEKFDGESRKFESFKLKFCTLVSGGSFITPKDRAAMLFNSLSGDVVDQLDHIVDLERPDAYERIWRSLDRDYGRFQYGTFSHVTELQSIQQWPQCETSADLLRLYKFVKHHYMRLEQAGQAIQAETVKITLLGKLKGRALNKSSTLIKQSGDSPVIRRMLDIMRDDIDDMEIQDMAKGFESRNSSTGIKPILKSNLVSGGDNSHGPMGYYNGPSQDSYGVPQQAISNYGFFTPGYDTPTAQNGLQMLSQANYVGGNTGNRVQWADQQPSAPPRSPPGSPRTRNISQQAYQQEMENRMKHRCLFCVSDEHLSKECTKFGANESRQILTRFRLCYNCFGQGHGNYKCLLPKACTKSCPDQVKHATQLCHSS